MRALVIVCGSSDEAGGIRDGLRDNGWNAVATGPVEGVEVREGEDVVRDQVPGQWVVFASRETLEDD